MEIWNPSWDQPGPRGLLQAYVYEDLARRVCAEDDASRIRFALETIEKVHPGLTENFEGGVAKCWGEDPWARGAYTLDMPGQLSNGWNTLIERPEGRIYFAGEHVSPYPAGCRARCGPATAWPKRSTRARRRFSRVVHGDNRAGASYPLSRRERVGVRGVPMIDRPTAIFTWPDGPNPLTLPSPPFGGRGFSQRKVRQ